MSTSDERTVNILQEYYPIGYMSSLLQVFDNNNGPQRANYSNKQLNLRM